MNTDSTIEFTRSSEGYAEIHIDGEQLLPERSLKVWNHSPSGFEWGYGGSGPAQTALALILEAGVPDGEALKLHQFFKFEMVAVLDTEATIQGADVFGWIEGNLRPVCHCTHWDCMNKHSCCICSRIIGH